MHFEALLSNSIESDLAYYVAAWRDASTALFFVGYGTSTVDANDTPTAACTSGHHGLNNKIAYTGVMEARIAGPRTWRRRARSVCLAT